MFICIKYRLMYQIATDIYQQNLGKNESDAKMVYVYNYKTLIIA